MTDNVPVKEISAGELVKLRAENDFCRLGLYVQSPATVYTMRVNQTFASRDRVVELIYDGGSGTYTDAFAGMTVLVSATAYGKHDKGICRLRAVLPSATTGTMKISEVSNIKFEDDDYITIIKSFALWQKDITTDNEVIKMDYDIEFGDYQNGGVVANIGPIAAVIFRTAGTVDFTPVSPALSASYDGSTIVSHLYVCPTASAVVNPTTNTPTLTFITAGEHLYWIEILDSLGRTTKSYRWVIVDPVSAEFELLDMDCDDGGWNFKVKTDSDMNNIYDRAMVVLYETFESYGGVSGAIGKLAGYENIENVGFIDGKTISLNSIEGFSVFEVKDASYWLSIIRSLPFNVNDVSGVASSWTEINELTLDKGLFHMLFWNSTVLSIMDCFLTDDTKRVEELVSPSDNLWAQITDMAFGKIKALPRVNSLGQLFVQVDPQFMTTTEQDALIVVQHIEKQDYEEGVEITIMEDRVSRVELSGDTEWDGTTSVPVLSKAPGSIGSTFGEPVVEDNYLFADQDDCNRISGILYALGNNPYEPIDIEFASQNKFFDIAPAQVGTITILAADNPLGVALTTVRLIPRGIKRQYASGGYMSSMITFEFLVNDVVDVVDGVTDYPPTPSDPNVDPNYVPGGGGGQDYPGIDDWFPDDVPDMPDDPTCNVLSINSYSSRMGRPEIRGDDDVLIAKCYFPCVVHGGAIPGVDHTQTVLKIGATFFGDLTPANVSTLVGVYAISGGTRVLTASLSAGSGDGFGGNTITATFSSASPLAVDGFELELDAGLGATVEYVPLDVIESGTVNANDQTGDAISPLIATQYYSVEGRGDAWWNGVANGYSIGFYNDNGVYAEQVTPTIARSYYLAGATSRNVTVGDAPGQFGDNTGTARYIVRNARADGRRITLGQVVILNVCP